MKSYIKIKLTHKFYSVIIYNIKIGNNLKYPSTGKWKNKLWSVQFSQLSCPTPCDPMDCSTLGFPLYYQLPESTQIHIHHVGDTIQSSHPLSSPSPPTFFPSIRVFSNESALRVTWPKYWSFSLSISPSSECSGLISFRMDWLALLAVQGTLKSLLQYHSSVQFSSVAQSCPTLSDPMNRSTPGLPVHHQLPEFTQTHSHRVGDAIQPSHPLSSPSPPALNLSQHRGLFK